MQEALHQRPAPPASPPRPQSRSPSQRTIKHVMCTPKGQGVHAHITKSERTKRAHRQGGMNIHLKADTGRTDVQRAYQQLYFSANDMDTVDGVASALQRRFRAASYRMGGEDWKLLFRTYDSDNDGALSLKEFIHAVRTDAQVTPAVLSDAQLEDAFNRIDIDGNCAISCDEFLKWRGSKRDTQIHQHTQSAQEDGSDESSAGDSSQRTKNRVPFVAEYIALQRATMRSGQDLSSPRIGTLDSGEVVAVLQVRGRRLKVQRLKCYARPTSGWVSERGTDLKPIMEMLPRSEWTSLEQHTIAVATRVASLNALPEKRTMNSPSSWYTSIFEHGDKSRPIKGARNPTDGSRVSVPHRSADAFVEEALKESEARVDRLARAMERAIEEREAVRTAALADAEMAKTAFEEIRQESLELERKRLRKEAEDRLAGEELMKCQSAGEAKELLDLLENTHRARWDSLLLGKQVEVERIQQHRAALSRDRKKQMLMFSAGVRQARGQNVECETSATDRATRASSALFGTLAGRSDEQGVERKPECTANSTRNGENATVIKSCSNSSIDRILKRFSPRSGGALRSAVAHTDTRMTGPV